MISILYHWWTWYLICKFWEYIVICVWSIILSLMYDIQEICHAGYRLVVSKFDENLFSGQMQKQIFISHCYIHLLSIHLSSQRQRVFYWDRLGLCYNPSLAPHGHRLHRRLQVEDVQAHGSAHDGLICRPHCHFCVYFPIIHNVFWFCGPYLGEIFVRWHMSPLIRNFLPSLPISKGSIFPDQAMGCFA